MQSCDSCSSPVPDTGVICRSCTRALRRDLLAVPALLAELHVTATRQDRIAIGQRGSGERPIPWGEHASRSAVALVSALDLLARAAVALERPRLVPAWPVDRAEWLVAQLNALRQWRGVVGAADRLSGAVQDAQRAIDRPEEKTRFLVGPCPMPGPEPGGCDGAVWAHIPHDGGAYLACRRDDAHRWTTERWLRAGRLIHRRMAELAVAG